MDMKFTECLNIRIPEISGLIKFFHKFYKINSFFKNAT